MTPIEIYCIGAATQALYMAIKWVGHGREKRAKLRADPDKKVGPEDAKIVCAIAPFVIVLMILIWPYTLIDRFILKREKK